MQIVSKETYSILNAWICQPHPGQLTPLFGDMIIGQGRIREVHPADYHLYLAGKPAGKPRPVPGEIIDAACRVVTVPLINFHDHFYSRLAKGLPVSGPQDTFLHILENLWWKLDRLLDEDMIRASVQLGIQQSIRNGVTYIFDHHSSPARTGHVLDMIADQIKESRLRGVVCLETSDRNGQEDFHAALQENRRFLLEKADREVTGMLGLHAPFTLSDDSLRMAARSLAELDSAIHIHLAEDLMEQKFSQQRFGISAAERLNHFNLLTGRSLLGHGVHLVQKDYELITRAGSTLVYNPDSNLNNQVGLPVYREVPDGITIVPGTDGMHASIARTLKQLFLLHRHQGHSFHQSFAWIQKIYFDTLVAVKNFFPDFPALQPSDRADLIIWDYVPPTPLTRENIWGHFIYGVWETPPYSVMQEGKLLLHQHQYSGGDDQEAVREICRQGERLYGKFQQKGKKV